MHRFTFFALIIAALCLSACATRKAPALQSKKTTTVVTVARNGSVRIDKKRVKLQGLVGTLKSMGVTQKSHLAVQGETGADQREIEQVLETLVDGGLLPKGTID